MQQFKRILKGVVVGFIGLVVVFTLIALLTGEEVTPEATEQASLGIFTIDGDDSLFEGYSDARVEIWASEVPDTLSDSRELVTKLDRGAEVELLQRDENSYYCKVRHKNDEGWLDCEWLK